MVWKLSRRRDAAAMQVGVGLPRSLRPSGNKSGITCVADVPEVVLLRYAHIPKTVETVLAAFQDDPIEGYVFRPPDTNGSPRYFIYEALRRAALALSFKEYVKMRRAFTVNKGNSVVLHSPAFDDDAPHRTPSRLESLITRLSRICSTPQQRRRAKEWQGKFTAALEKHVGPHADEFFSVDGLATHPAFQGHGYGSALMNAVSALVDEVGCRTWLGSSNPVNQVFYESFSYVAVAEIVLGDDPDYTGKPIVALLMIREPKGKSSVCEKAAL
ncbi:hypothetical protein FA95DRAFT_1129694 [Auriscalpium vulgare]|uniref:Uncharacterized protein n=1 Tax=Auriscalpium vulgare TaxID=40419 RepID=A0ACB8RW43_9AGAM|nr:hypothetical protein FA95DRAFT_1129694 [Auriscalpium vulgare]